MIQREHADVNGTFTLPDSAQASKQETAAGIEKIALERKQRSEAETREKLSNAEYFTMLKQQYDDNAPKAWVIK